MGKGFSEIPSVDFHETYSPNVCSEALHAFIALAESYPDTLVLFACPVASINPGDGTPSAKPSVTLDNGKVIEGDIIIGADGIRSITRSVVTGEEDTPLNTSDAAFR